MTEMDSNDVRDYDDVQKLFDYYKSKLVLDKDSDEIVFRLDATEPEGSKPLIFARAEVFFNIQYELELLVDKAAIGLMKLIGHKHGSKFAEFIQTSDFTASIKGDPAAINTYVENDTCAIGWGCVSVEEDASSGDIKITSPKGLVTCKEFKRAGIGNRDSASAFFIGYFEALYSTLRKITYRATGIECVLKGDDNCGFTLVPE